LKLLLDIMQASINSHNLGQAILAKAGGLGADIAGVAAWEQVMAGPSLAIQAHLSSWQGVGAVRDSRQHTPCLTFSPSSLVVVGLAHPGSQPELDWWQTHIPGRTIGNAGLLDVTTGLTRWLDAKYGIAAADLAYHVEHGGVFLKDAAVLAGLGVVGRNNLLLCPELGPRVRLRALAVAAEINPSTPMTWDPCLVCPEPCRQACPQNAFSPSKRTIDGQTPEIHLPARDGAYQRNLCNQQMEADIAAGREFFPKGSATPAQQVRYCRRCERSCPVGR
jgi:epoxyqueuosine reductase